MTAKGKTAVAARQRRHARVRAKVRGTVSRPRLCVFRSLTHIYAQVIDDDAGRTLVAASDMEKALTASRDGKKKTDVATAVGELVGQRAREKGIEQVVFDRGGYRFHGRVKALAEAARKAGLRF
ncbi:MAG TPA: 50S ribosomal protein L18 [Dehalococcoidia bacterium]|nr:50S ribosomal protein L18 [Dehalococcoidia bacterium]